MTRTAMLVVIGVLLQACTWVELAPEGENVRVLDAAAVVNCKKLGTTRVRVKADIVGLDRYPEDVRQELETLARNSAADMDGDTVVPMNEPQDGKQSYGVYRCIES